MSRAPQWMAWGGIGLFAVGLGAALFVELVTPDSALRTLWARYLASLDKEIRFLFYTTHGEKIGRWQISLGLTVLIVALLTETPLLVFLLPVVAVAPLISLRQRHRERVQRIEGQLDAWLLILANALKATPSLGEAMAASAQIVRPPLRQELDLCLKEIQLGTPLDQAVMNTSERIGSRAAAGALATILVGRQTGGDLPRILEESAATLREMARLEGVVRTKTAEGKSQAYVLGGIPFFLLGAIDYIDPHWLTPLTETTIGYVVILVASLLWGGAILLARKILAVDV